MSNELDGIDFAQDFEDLALGTEEITVSSIDARTGEVLKSVECVTAAKLIRKGSTGPARSGEVWTAKNEWWLRVDQLGFELKPVDQITGSDGTVWIVDEVNEVVGALVRCPVTKKR